MTSSPIPDLDARGFIRVQADQEPDLWLTCQTCQKSDHFWVDEAIHCSCGAHYDHTITPSGQRVGMEGLAFVPFNQGPMQLADLELDPRRVALLGLAVVLIVALGWLMWP